MLAAVAALAFSALATWLWSVPMARAAVAPFARLRTKVAAIDIDAGRASGLGVIEHVVEVDFHRRLDFRDTSRWVYDWFGNWVFERSEGSGETSTLASDSTQWEHRALARLSATRELSEGQRLRLVLAPDFTTRNGTERLRVNPDRLDPLTTERRVLQLVAGLEHSLQSVEDIIDSSAFAKYYLYRPSTDQVEVFDNSIRHIEDSTHRIGFGDALRVWFLPGLMGKLSYEYATRLPRPDEVFGDGSLVLPNVELSPETGHNANAGLLIEGALGPSLGGLSLEASGFLRHTEQMVVRLLAEDRVHSIHQNVGTAQTLGVDGVARWTSPCAGSRSSSTPPGKISATAPRAAPSPPSMASASRIAPGCSSTPRRRFVCRISGPATPSWPCRGSRATCTISALAGSKAPATRPTASPRSSRTRRASSTPSAARALDFALDLANVTNERVFDVLGVQRPGRAAFFKITIGWSQREGEAPAPAPAAAN